MDSKYFLKSLEEEWRLGVNNVTSVQEIYQPCQSIK